MDTLLQFGLSNALMATVLALPAALVGRLCQRPALAHALWLLVLLKLLTPPLLPVPILWVSSPVVRMTTVAAPRPDLDSETETTGAPRVPAHLAQEAVAQESLTTVAAPSTGPSLLTHSADPTTGVLAGLPWSWVVGMLWVTGSALWFATLGCRAYRFQRLLRSAGRAPSDIQERAGWLAKRIGVARCPGVWFIPGRVSPMLWALAGPPRLLLPSDLWSQLSGTQRDTLLAHELAHLRRRDHWVRWLELAAVGLYWWHPVAWWVERELHETGEQCCDAWVVAVLPAAADAYAEALLETVAYLSRARVAKPVGASAAGRVHFLKRRLIMILNATAPKALSPASRWAVLALGAVLLPLWPTSVHSQVSPDSGSSPAGPVDLAAAPAQDEGRAEQIGQARAAVQDLTAELEQMQALVERFARSLHEAHARLARLEGRQEPPAGMRPMGRPSLLSNQPAMRGELPRADGGKAPPQPLPTQTGAKGPTDKEEHWRRQPLPTQTGAKGPTDREDGWRPGPQPSTPHGPDMKGTSPDNARANPLNYQYQKGSRGKEQAGPANRFDGSDYDQRLREVEAKLDRLLEEIKTLRERSPSKRPDGN